MAIKTIIIGKNSNLSRRLAATLSAAVLVSARDVLADVKVLEPFKESRIKLVLNNFQTSTELDSLQHPSDYIDMAIVTTAKVLEYFCFSQVEKVIYTSSSSVYGNNILCTETDDLQPLNLHAALKVANERLVSKVCEDNGIDYTLARIFNMYGGEDKFSVISKIINACQNRQTMTLVNNGNAIRDFTHIDDVVDIYRRLIEIPGLPIINVGTGNGQSIKSIMDFLRHHNISLNIRSIERDEIKVSTASNRLLIETVGKKDFIEIEDYLTRALGL